MIALTGSIGSGKSLASNIFLKLGAKVVSADILARRVLVEDMEARPLIVGVLGEDSFMPDGTPIAKKIADIVFHDSSKLRALEDIIHPRTRLLWEAQMRGADGMVVVEIPLLFEKKLEKRFDICATVYCSERIRLDRLAGRGLAPDEIAARDAFQMPAAEKANLSDVVFFNDGAAGFLEDQISIFVNRLYGRRE